ncbi:glycosyltransferase family 4 protein [Echinicola marina]|uniref:glycosyltransferase family 4 protein n=1 Tax=Echinicola marina TaxID=2859768 RepID=UPI001CF6D6E2|nr:glycosyltransferase family 4 protein [Echinicola marina]UCS94389.1 glycosyltransferase family 4 protein [Echinicola marina]
MRIIYIHQYFVTPEEGGAVRSYHLAKGLVETGVEVEMITAHSSGEYDFKMVEGIKVHYLPVAYDNTFGFAKRSVAFFSFVRLAKQLLKKLNRPDLLYITSTPLTTGLIGLWAKRRLALPYIFEVRDLWPEAPVQVGAVKNPVLKKALYKLEKRIYQHALKIVALSPGIRNYIENIVPAGDISLIPNFSDVKFFKPSFQKDEEYLKELDWKKEALSFAYTGAIGDVNAVGELLDFAEEAQLRNKNWQFAIMGKGKRLAALKIIAKEKKLNNLKFLPFGDKVAVRKLLSVTDVSFISFDHLPVLKTNSPNKFFDAIAMGNAIMVNHKGWVYNLVKRNKIGVVYDSQKMDLGIAKMEALDADRKRLKGMKHRASDLAVLHFSKEKALSRLLFTLDPKKYPLPTIDEVYMLIA